MNPAIQALKALANINGKIMPLAEVMVPALDRGFLFGDAVYEALWAHQGKMWLEEPHFRRLERGLKLVRIQGIDIPRLIDRCYQTLEAAKYDSAFVYIQITRGAAPRAHAFPQGAVPLELLYVQEFIDPYATMRQEGISLHATKDIRWEHCDIKSTNLLANVLAIQEAKEAGCQEVLFHMADGTITESGHSSLFGVLDGVLFTSPCNESILPGITREYILELAAKLEIPSRTRSLALSQLGQVRELFITGTTSGVLPVTRVDQWQIGDGKPGPVTQRLSQAYWESVREWSTKNPGEEPGPGI